MLYIIRWLEKVLWFQVKETANHWEKCVTRMLILTNSFICRKFSLLKDTGNGAWPILSGFISASQWMSPVYKEEHQISLKKQNTLWCQEIPRHTLGSQQGLVVSLCWPGYISHHCYGKLGSTQIIWCDLMRWAMGCYVMRHMRLECKFRETDVV